MAPGVLAASGSAAGAASAGTGSIRGALRVAAAPGLLGLYRGVGPTLAGILPYAGLKFYVYQGLKQAYGRSRVAESAPLEEQEAECIPQPPTHVKLAFAQVTPIQATPTTLVIDQEGRVAARIIGQLASASILSTLVADTLAEDTS